MYRIDKEEIGKAEKVLIDLYTKENKDLEYDLTELLKETEQKASEIRERIAENKRFINAMKLKVDENLESET
jgi:hypothetical protein